VVEGDLSDPVELPTGGFDEVLCNPPHKLAAASAPPDRAKALATHEGPAGLENWVDVALTFARANGGLTFVHRADRLDDLLAALRGKAGGVVVFPLWPSDGQPAKRVLVRARKAIRAPARLSQGLVLHDAQGRYTAAAGAVLRGGEGLAL
jgi:tRNA1(Val) A37 N6-methylase TrmN6